jgi:hypothetical protein
MINTCVKCGKTYNREIDLCRHMNRKIPCNRKLSCDLCFKNFTRLGDLKRHMNKKRPCVNSDDLKVVLANLEIVKLKVMLELRHADIILEQEKTKQVEAKKITNITNITGDQINTIINFDQVQLIKPVCQYDAQLLIKTNDHEHTLTLMILSLFGGDVKYFEIDNKKIYIKINNEIVEFRHGRLKFNTLIKELCEFIRFNYEKYSDEEMYKYAVSQRSEYIPNDEINTVNRVSNFVGDHRYDKHVEIIITDVMS